MNIHLDSETRGVWLIYFLGTRENDPPMHGTLIEAIYQGTKDGRQFDGGRLGVVVTPISIELPAPQIEAGDGKIILLADAIAKLAPKDPATRPRAEEYRAIVEEMKENPSEARANKETLLRRRSSRADIAISAEGYAALKMNSGNHPNA